MSHKTKIILPGIEEALAFAQELLDTMESGDLPEAAFDYVASANETVKGIAETIERTQALSVNQWRALQNISAAVERWMENNHDWD